MANLAATYQNQVCCKEAEQLDVQVMESSQRILGEEHPVTLRSWANLTGIVGTQEVGRRKSSWMSKSWRATKGFLGRKSRYSDKQDAIHTVSNEIGYT